MGRAGGRLGWVGGSPIGKNWRRCRRSHPASPLMLETLSPQILPDCAACLPLPTCPCLPCAVPFWRAAQLPGGLPHPAQRQRAVKHIRGGERHRWVAGAAGQRHGGTGAPGSQACVIVWHTNLLALLLVSSVPAPAACCSASLLPGSAPWSQPSPLPACFLPPPPARLQCWPRAGRCSARCPPRCPPLTSGSTTLPGSTSTRQSRWVPRRGAQP